MSIQNKVVLDSAFNIESQTAETYKPFGNVSNVIELVAPTISNSAVLVSFKLPNQVLVSKRPMQLEEINVDSELRNRYTYAIPSAPLAISSNQSNPLKTIITEISFINPSGNADLGYTNKIDNFNKPSLLPLTATMPDLEIGVDYAVVLFEEDGTTPTGFIWQYTTLDTWTETAFEEIQKQENSTEIEFSVEAGFDVGQEPIDITTDTLILDQQANLQSDIIVINNILGDSGEKVVPRNLEPLGNLIGTGLQGRIYVQAEDEAEGYITIQQLSTGLTGVDKGLYDTGTLLYEDFPANIAEPDNNLGFLAGIKTIGTYSDTANPTFSVTTTIENEQVRWIILENNWVAQGILFAPDNDVLDAKITNNEKRLLDIKNGTNILGEGYDTVKKTEQDRLGNVIDATYETIANVDDVKGAGWTVETVKNNADNNDTNANAINDNKVDITAEKARNDAQDISIGESTTEIDNIKTGVTIVKKTEQDEEGVNIKDNYLKTLEVQDNGVKIGDYKVLNFVDNLIVSPGTGKANISSTGGEGSGSVAYAQNVNTNKGLAIDDVTPLKMIMGASWVTNDPTFTEIAFDGNNDFILKKDNPAGYKTGGSYLVTNVAGSPVMVTLNIYLDAVLKYSVTDEVSEQSDPGEETAAPIPFNTLLFPAIDDILTYELIADIDGATIEEFRPYVRPQFTTPGVPLEDLMFRSVYDNDISGVVDDSERLGGQLPAFYAPQSALDTTDGNVLTNTTNIDINATNTATNTSGVANNKVEVEQRLLAEDFVVGKSAGVQPYRPNFGLGIFTEGGFVINTPTIKDNPVIPQFTLFKTVDQTVVQGTTEVITFGDNSATQPFFSRVGNGVQEDHTSVLSDYFVKLYVKYNNASSLHPISGTARLLRNGVPTGIILTIPSSATDKTTILQDFATDVTVAQGDIFTANLAVDANTTSNASITIIAQSPDSPLSIFGATKDDPDLYDMKIRNSFLEEQEGVIPYSSSAVITHYPTENKKANMLYAKMTGQTLEQEVINGDFSNGITNWIGSAGNTLFDVVGGKLRIESVLVNTFVQQNVSLGKNGDEIFVYAPNTTDGTTSIFFYSNKAGGGDDFVNIDNGYGTLSLTDDSNSFQIGRKVSFDGTFIQFEDYIIAFNKTGTIYENSTDDELVQLARNGYFESFAHSGGPFKTTGKNIFDGKFDSLITDLEFKQIEVNEFTIKGNNTSDIGKNIFPNIKFETNKQYVFSGNVSEDDDTKNTRLKIIYTDDTSDDIFIPDLTPTDFSVTSNISKTINKIGYDYSISNGTTTVINFMITELGTNQDYEPYVELIETAPQLQTGSTLDGEGNLIDTYGLVENHNVTTIPADGLTGGIWKASNGTDFEEGIIDTDLITITLPVELLYQLTTPQGVVIEDKLLLQTSPNGQIVWSDIPPLLEGDLPAGQNDVNISLWNSARKQEKQIDENRADIASKANDTEVVKLAGTQTITGDKDFTGTLTVDGSSILVRDKIVSATTLENISSAAVEEIITSRTLASGDILEIEVGNASGRSINTTQIIKIVLSTSATTNPVNVGTAFTWFISDSSSHIAFKRVKFGYSGTKLYFNNPEGATSIAGAPSVSSTVYIGDVWYCGNRAD